MKPPIETLSDKVQDKSKETLELYNQQLLQKGPRIESLNHAGQWCRKFVLTY